jgi:hypothetical protein
MKTMSRRDAANMLTSRQGVQTTQAAVDSMWSQIVTRLNSTLAGRAPIVAARPSPGASGFIGRVNAAVDWASIASALNTEAGLKTPARIAGVDVSTMQNCWPDLYGRRRPRLSAS